MAQHNELTTPIDRVSKLLFRKYADLLLRLTFPDRSVRLISVEENVEINLPTRPVDTVMIISTDEGGREVERVLHVEYYARHRADVPRTLFVYSGELTDRMGMDVITVVVYSERREVERRPAPEYVVQVGERVMNRFMYTDIWIQDYEAQIRSGELAPLAPYLLEIVPSPTVETLKTAKALAQTEPQLERRTLLLSLVALLAGRYFDKEFVREMFRKEIDMMQTNTFFDEWLEEAEQRGIEKGRQEGREEEAQALLLSLLEHRFETVPVRLVLQIQSLSIEELNRLFELTLTATSLQEVEQAAHDDKRN